MREGEDVSRRLLRLEIPVFPDQGSFRLRDAVADLDAQTTPLAPLGALISANREQLRVGSLQRQVQIQLTVEEWDGAPAPFGENWEDEAKAVLYLRGAIGIDTGAPDRSVCMLRLVGGVGDYVVRVFARNRREVARLYGELFERGLDPLGDEFHQARSALDGLEQYLMQIWREG